MQMICSRLTASMVWPVRQMNAVSPLATPSSMIAAFRLGRKREAMVPISDNTTTTLISRR